MKRIVISKKNNKYKGKYKSRKNNRILVGGNKYDLTLEKLYLPSPENLVLKTDDSMLDVAYNTLQMYNIDITKDEIKRNFIEYVRLVKDAVEKVNNNYDMDYSKDSNVLLKKFSENYNNYEMIELVSALDYSVSIFSEYKSLGENKGKRHILDQLYQKKMDMMKEIDKEDQEYQETFNKLNESLMSNEQFYQKYDINVEHKGGAIVQHSKTKVQQGGAALMKTIGKFGMVLGALPIVTQIMTHSFHYNIFEFITGSERENLRKNILKQVMNKGKHSGNEDEEGEEDEIKEVTSLKGFLDKIEKLQEDVYELDLYLNSFFMSYYLKKDKKEKVWEDYTDILRTKRDIKRTNNPLDQLKSDLGKLDINLNPSFLFKKISDIGEETEAEALGEMELQQTLTPAPAIEIPIEQATTKNVNILKGGEPEKAKQNMIQLEGVTNTESSTDPKEPAAAEPGAAAEPPAAEAAAEPVAVAGAAAEPPAEGTDPIEPNNTKKAVVSEKFINVRPDGSLENKKLERQMERYNDVQSTKEQEIKEERINEYYETAKPIVDLLGIMWDQLRGTFAEQDAVALEEAGVPSEAAAAAADAEEVLEPMNPFDLLAALMSLSKGEYPDFAMEMLPVLMSTMPHLKGPWKKFFDKMNKDKGKGKGKRKQLNEKQRKQHHEAQYKEKKKKMDEEYGENRRNKTREDIETENETLLNNHQNNKARIEADEEFQTAQQAKIDADTNLNKNKKKIAEQDKEIKGCEAELKEPNLSPAKKAEIENRKNAAINEKTDLETEATTKNLETKANDAQTEYADKLDKKKTADKDMYGETNDPGIGKLEKEKLEAQTNKAKAQEEFDDIDRQLKDKPDDTDLLERKKTAEGNLDAANKKFDDTEFELNKAHGKQAQLDADLELDRIEAKMDINKTELERRNAMGDNKEAAFEEDIKNRQNKATKKKDLDEADSNVKKKEKEIAEKDKEIEGYEAELKKKETDELTKNQIKEIEAKKTSAAAERNALNVENDVLKTDLEVKQNKYIDIDTGDFDNYKKKHPDIDDAALKESFIKETEYNDIIKHSEAQLKELDDIYSKNTFGFGKMKKKRDPKYKRLKEEYREVLIDKELNLPKKKLQGEANVSNRLNSITEELETLKTRKKKTSYNPYQNATKREINKATKKRSQKLRDERLLLENKYTSDMAKKSATKLDSVEAAKKTAKKTKQTAKKALEAERKALEAEKKALEAEKKAEKLGAKSTNEQGRVKTLKKEAMEAREAAIEAREAAIAAKKAKRTKIKQKTIENKTKKYKTEKHQIKKKKARLDAQKQIAESENLLKTLKSEKQLTKEIEDITKEIAESKESLKKLTPTDDLNKGIELFEELKFQKPDMNVYRQATKEAKKELNAKNKAIKELEKKQEALIQNKELRTLHESGIKTAKEDFGIMERMKRNLIHKGRRTKKLETQLKIEEIKLDKKILKEKQRLKALESQGRDIEKLLKDKPTHGYTVDIINNPTTTGKDLMEMEKKFGNGPIDNKLREIWKERVAYEKSIIEHKISSGLHTEIPGKDYEALFPGETMSLPNNIKQRAIRQAEETQHALNKNDLKLEKLRSLPTNDINKIQIETLLEEQKTLSLRVQSKKLRSYGDSGVIHPTQIKNLYNLECKGVKPMKILEDFKANPGMFDFSIAKNKEFMLQKHPELHRVFENDPTIKKLFIETFNTKTPIDITELNKFTESYIHPQLHWDWKKRPQPQIVSEVQPVIKNLAEAEVTPAIARVQSASAADAASTTKQAETRVITLNNELNTSSIVNSITITDTKGYLDSIEAQAKEMKIDNTENLTALQRQIRDSTKAIDKNMSGKSFDYIAIHNQIDGLVRSLSQEYKKKKEKEKKKEVRKMLEKLQEQQPLQSKAILALLTGLDTYSFDRIPGVKDTHKKAKDDSKIYKGSFGLGGITTGLKSKMFRGGSKTKKLRSLEKSIFQEIKELKRKNKSALNQLNDKQIEFETLINIKFRHNVSEKINLSKQELMLDKVLKLYEPKIDKNNQYVKEIKEKSKDKKINYFTNILQGVSGEFMNKLDSSFNLFKNSLEVHLRIRELTSLAPDKEIEFNKKYDIDVKNNTNNQDEFSKFLIMINTLKEMEEEEFKNFKLARIQLEKTEISYDNFEQIKFDFEDKQKKLILYKNRQKKSGSEKIKKYLKDYEEIQNNKKLEEDFYLFIELIKSNIVNYNNDLEEKMKYFVKIQELCKEEIVYIKNEFSLFNYFKLQITKDNKEKLYKILEEMYYYFEQIIKNLIKFNQVLEDKLLPAINEENLVIEKEKKFIDDTLSKIKLKNKQIEFQYKMTKKENLFKIFYTLKHNIDTEIIYNKEIIAKCYDFMNFIEYEINYIDTQYLHKRIIHKTKRRKGIIDTSNLKNISLNDKNENNKNSKNENSKNNKNDVYIQKNKLTNILGEIATLTTRKKKSKKNLKTRQNERMNNIDKIVSNISKLTTENEQKVVGNRERYEREKVMTQKRLSELNKIKNTKKNSIIKMGEISKKYNELHNPLDLLAEKNILTKKKNKYVLNKEFLNSKKVKITKKMNRKLSIINKNLKHLEKINSDTTFYNTK